MSELQGVYTASGQFVEFDSRDDLWEARIDLLLHDGPLRCACRKDMFLGITVVAPRIEESSLSPHMRRLHDLDQHGPGCIFHRKCDRWAGPGKRAFTGEIFSNLNRTSELDEGLSAWTLLRFSQLYTEAFHAVGHRPKWSQIHAGLKAELADKHKPGTFGRSLSERARSGGLRIVSGICDDVTFPLENVATTESAWPLLIQGVEDSAAAPQYFEAGPTVLAEAGRRCSVFGRIIRPPYFAVGLLQESTGILVSLILVPIALEGDLIASVDSDFERIMVCDYWGEGAAPVYKPLRKEELNALPGEYRSARDRMLKFRYRPDLLSRLNDRPLVVEGFGFPKIRTYYQAFMEKERYWCELERAGHIYYRRSVASDAHKYSPE
jgi:hypothetical protein